MAKSIYDYMYSPQYSYYDTYNLPPESYYQEQAQAQQQPQGGGMAGTTGSLTGLYLASQLAAPSTTAATVATPTILGAGQVASAAAPTVAAPTILSASVPSAGATAATAAPTAGIGLGALGAGAATVGGTMLLGKLIERAFFGGKKGPARPFKPDELLDYDKSQKRVFHALPGLSKAKREDQIAALNKLKEAKAVQLAGFGMKDASGNITTDPSTKALVNFNLPLPKTAQQKRWEEDHPGGSYFANYNPHQTLAEKYQTWRDEGGETLLNNKQGKERQRKLEEALSYVGALGK